MMSYIPVELLTLSLVPSLLLSSEILASVDFV